MGEGVWYISHLEIVVRLLSAFLLGAVIGIEREMNNHHAGFRTHILVTLGSALIMVLSIYGFPQFVNEPNVRTDPARLAAQVVSGIGFLGAGTILRHGFSVSGLTTAASLWVSGGIGLACGAGFYFGAFISTGIVIFALLILNRLETKFFRSRRVTRLCMQLIDKPTVLQEVTDRITSFGYSVKDISIERMKFIGGEGQDIVDITVAVKGDGSRNLAELIGWLSASRELHKINVVK